jgi:hypothetical protein
MKDIIKKEGWSDDSIIKVYEDEDFAAKEGKKLLVDAWVEEQVILSRVRLTIRLSLQIFVQKAANLPTYGLEPYKTIGEMEAWARRFKCIDGMHRVVSMQELADWWEALTQVRIFTLFFIMQCDTHRSSTAQPLLCPGPHHCHGNSLVFSLYLRYIFNDQQP